MPTKSEVEEAVRGLQALVEADGGAFDLIGFDPEDGVLTVRLALEHVSCAECLLPPEMLHEIATGFVRETVPAIKSINLQDPRTSGPVA